MKKMDSTFFILIAFLANAAFANSPLGPQIATGFLDSFLSQFIPILIFGAIISIGLTILSKRPEFVAYGCGGIFILTLVIGILTTLIHFVKTHSTAFIIAGIIIIFIISILIVIAYFERDKQEPIETVIPKIKEPPHYHFSTKPVTNQAVKGASSFAEATETQTKTPISSIPSHTPATYEEIVGEIPSAKEIAGKVGEDAVSKAIWTACEYDKRYYKLLRNVYIPKPNGKYSEIDVLLLHETGVYVFESKNLSGTVYGDYQHPQWERYKKNGEKDFIVNPIKQNEGHIKALCNFLNLNKFQLRAFNMVVFGSKAELKYIPENSTFNSIHEIYNLEMELIKKMASQKNFYSQKTIDSWCSLLVPCMMLPDEEKQKHKEQVNSNFNIIN
ncbi:nuclease-related domain-containing protein [Fibrobacter sp.]|uniref:nuclease-related domain-containing protein n=1 Tax=Fibrobacter sp. TaxID=35828 RepID=UPI0038662977